MKVLITGATGFLGGNLLEYFLSHQTEQFKVFPTGRNCKAIPQIYRTEQWELGDLADEEFVENLLLKIKPTHIIHCAAKSENYGEMVLFEQANIQATENLLKYSKKHLEGIQFIHISTPSIYAKTEHQYNIQETVEIDEGHIRGNPYIWTKYQAEKIIAKYREQGMKIVIIRPRALLGYKDETIWPRLMKASKSIGIPLFRKGRCLLSYTLVTNLSIFLFSLVTEQKQCNETIHVADGEMELGKLIELVRQKANYPIRTRRLSYPMLKGLVNALEKIWWKESEPPLTQANLDLLFYDLTFDTTKAKKMGYCNKTIFVNEIEKIVSKWNQEEQKWITH